MAIDNKYCVEQPPIVVTKKGGGKEKKKKKKGDPLKSPKTNVVPVVASPPKPIIPFPKPVLQEGDSPQASEKYSPVFTSGTRQVTVSLDNLFISKQNNVHKIKREDLKLMSNLLHRRPPLHGGVFFKNNNYSADNPPDFFRWSLLSVWSSDKNSEFFVNPTTGHGTQLRKRAVYDDLETERQRFFDDDSLKRLKHSKVFDLYRGHPNELMPDRKYEIKEERLVLNQSAEGQFQEAQEGFNRLIRGDNRDMMTWSEYEWDETIRFIVQDPSSGPLASNEGFENFINHFAPLAIVKSDYTRREKLNLFMDVTLFGDFDSAIFRNVFGFDGTTPGPIGGMFDFTSPWSVFTGLGPPPKIQNYYRKGMINFDETFRDYVFDAPVAFFEEEMNNMLLSPFHSAKITTQIGSSDLLNEAGYFDERQIPNAYRLYTFLDLEKKHGSPESQTNPAQQYAWNIAQEYLKEWRNPELEEDDNYVGDRVVKIPSDRVAKLDEINEFMRQYAPNVVEIQINTTQGGHINSLLQRNKMDRLLMEVIHPSFSPEDLNRLYPNVPGMTYDDDQMDDEDPGFSPSPAGSPKTPAPGRGPGMPNPKDPIPGSSAEDEKTRETLLNKFYEFSQSASRFSAKHTFVLDDSFLNSENGEQNAILRTINDRTEAGIEMSVTSGFLDVLKKDLPNSGGATPQIVKPGNYPLLYTGWDNVPLLRFEEAIKSQIFVSELEKYISQNGLHRSYSDILSGKKSYSETLGYRVEKYSLEKDENGKEIEELVQVILLMDNNDIDRINYLDSQILPFKKYKYKIFTINFVIGSEYEYNPAKTRVKAPIFDLNVATRKQIYIVNAPFFEQVVHVRDMPPLEPQVNFLPYQGVEDKFGILLTTNYGEVTEQRISLNAGPLTWKGKPYEVTFKTDSLPTHFQAIRLEQPPESWTDFGTTSPDPNKEQFLVEANSNSAFLLQNVEPNKYYYYVFRAFDNFKDGKWVRGKTMISNPTEVYRVRMVSYENGIFMEMEPYEMYKKPKEIKVEFERYLKICPNYDQTLVNFSETFKRLADPKNSHIPDNALKRLRKDLNLEKGNQHMADSIEFQQSAPAQKEISLGIKENPEDLIWSRKFKFRIKSKNTGKAIDLNVKFVRKQDLLTKEE